MLPDGSGEVQVFGNPADAFVPTFISHGRNLAIHVPDVFRAAKVLSSHRLVGATWTKSQDEGSVLMSYRDVSNTANPGWQT
jgi:hypothetical protein